MTDEEILKWLVDVGAIDLTMLYYQAITGKEGCDEVAFRVRQLQE
jgi:hypothetical protein